MNTIYTVFKLSLREFQNLERQYQPVLKKIVLKSQNSIVECNLEQVKL